MKKTKKGFLIHAFGKEPIDYGRLALCCAFAIKSNLKENNVTVVADHSTRQHLKNTIRQDILNAAIDNIIVPFESFESSDREQYDTPWIKFSTKFNNQSRILSYQFSPYDETIVLDSDYIVMNDSLDQVWGCKDDVLINKKARDLRNRKFGTSREDKLSKNGIPMYWATLVYFKKSLFAETFFDLVNYVRDEYSFFHFLYEFMEGVYRNDFSFSIAAHMLNGYLLDGINSFPEDSILTCHPKDKIVDMISSREFIIMAHQKKEPWKNTLVDVRNTNIHIMNKPNFLKTSDKFIKSCMEKL